MDKIKFFTGSLQEIERDVNEFIEIQKGCIRISDIKYRIAGNICTVMVWYKINLDYATQF
jgi:hypothetical protein